MASPGRREGAAVYLDHNSTTPVRPEVLEAMLPYLKSSYGNPNSVHWLGQQARKAVEKARASVAELIGAASPDEIVFTSCGSESDALAVQGAAFWAERAFTSKKRRIVHSAVEHEAVRGAVRGLTTLGFESTVVGVDGSGRLDAAAAAAAIGPDVCLVSVMHANNETGALQPVGEIAAAARARGALFHTDAVQSVGKIPVDVRALQADLLSLSGHKINAPKGVGALYVRSGTQLAPLIAGHQEKNRRGGTENVAGIAGLGAAAELARRELDAHARELSRLRERLERGALKIPGARLNSAGCARLPNTSHFCFEGVDGHHLVVSLDLEGLCASSGPACVGGVTGTSHVLSAMGIPPELAAGSLRVSLGWGNTEGHVDQLLAVLPRLVEKLKAVGIK